MMDRIETFRVLMRMIKAARASRLKPARKRISGEARIKALIHAAVLVRAWDGCEAPDDQVVSECEDLSKELDALATIYDVRTR